MPLISLQQPCSIFVFFLISSIFLNLSYSLSTKLFNASTPLDFGFSSGFATWYGSDDGAGSGAGACGWQNDVAKPPFSAMIAAGNFKIFQSGKGCGNCYQVKCTQGPYCSGNPITLTIADECPTCKQGIYHFDLSGHAFGALASRGHEDNLRKQGNVNLQYRRVPCNYGSTKISFKVQAKTNQFWFGTAIEYIDGDGGVTSLSIKAANSNQWVPLENRWGAEWQANINPSFKAPYSFKITSAGKTIVAINPVPYNFIPGNTYPSQVNF